MRTLDDSSTTFVYLLAGALAAALVGCATAGDNPDKPGADAAVSARCGNSTIDPGEACDGSNLDGQDCTTQGFEGGVLACDLATCTFATNSCYGCGDNTLNGSEECDGADLGGASCQALGYLGGNLGCDPTACVYDISGCETTETLVNDNGTCARSLGCNSNDGSGTSGNPQSLVECFRNATLQPPFWLDQLTYTISAAAGDQPGSLNVEVYSWTGSGVPGALVGSEAIPANQLGAGAHTITLNNPVRIDTADFCVGVNGSDVNDGFRIMFSDTSQTFGASYFVASTCNVTVFDAVSNIVGPGNWCLRPTIDKQAP